MSVLLQVFKGIRLTYLPAMSDSDDYAEKPAERPHDLQYLQITAGFTGKKYSGQGCGGRGRGKREFTLSAGVLHIIMT